MAKIFAQFEIRNSDGTPPAGLDVDGLVAAYVPTVSTWQIPTFLISTLGVPRNVTLTATDANASLGVIFAEIHGTDAQDRVQEEKLERAAAAGSGTTVGTKAFKTIDTSRSRVYVNPTVDAGVDTVSLGWGDVLGIPLDLDTSADLIERREDANASVGVIDVDLGTWTLSGGNITDAVNRYYMAGRFVLPE